MYAGATMCNHTEDAMELCSELGLYLKPTGRITISIAMPAHAANSVKVLSNWEVMEKIRKVCDPVQFTYLKVVKSTTEFMRYEGEVESRDKLQSVIDLLNGKIIKLGGYSESFKIRAKECKADVLTETAWNSFFEGYSEADETQPGLRPDTVYIEALPCRWFAHNQLEQDKQKMVAIEEKGTAVLPDAEVVQKVFGTFGQIRVMDIPLLDPYRCDNDRKGIGTFSAFGPGTSGITFAAFIQYEDYSSFATAMDALGRHKLLYKPHQGGKSYVANIKVDFDRSGHLSEKAIMKRKIDGLRLKQLEKEREEKARAEREHAEAQRRAQQLAAEAERLEEKRRLKKERKALREELKQKEKKEKLLLEIEQKNSSLERLRREQDKFQRRLLVEARRKQSIALLTFLIDKVKDLKSQEIVERRLADLEEARRAEVERQKLLVAQLEKRQAEEQERQKRLLEEHEAQMRKRLLKKFCNSDKDNRLAIQKSIQSSIVEPATDAKDAAADGENRLCQTIFNPQPQSSRHRSKSKSKKSKTSHRKHSSSSHHKHKSHKKKSKDRKRTSSSSHSDDSSSPSKKRKNSLPKGHKNSFARNGDSSSSEDFVAALARR